MVFLLRLSNEKIFESYFKRYHIRKIKTSINYVCSGNELRGFPKAPEIFEQKKELLPTLHREQLFEPFA